MTKVKNVEAVRERERERESLNLKEK